MENVCKGSVEYVNVVFIITQREMDRLLMERTLIERELDCSLHDPIEVVLIFDKSNSVDAETGGGYTGASETQYGGTKTPTKKRKRKRPMKGRPRPPHKSYSSGRGKRPKRQKNKKQASRRRKVAGNQMTRFVYSILIQPE